MLTKKHDKKEMFKGISFITQLGLSIVVPILIGVYLGQFLDNKFNTGMVFSIIFIILGAISGFMNIFKLGTKGPTKRK